MMEINRNSNQNKLKKQLLHQIIINQNVYLTNYLTKKADFSTPKRKIILEKLESMKGYYLFFF